MKRSDLRVAMVAGLLAACGSAGLDFLDVAGIPSGDDKGDRLAGEFVAIYRSKSNVCAALSSVGLPAKDVSVPLDVTVAQADGAITFTGIHVELNGGVQFDGRFEVGGSGFVSVGGQKNNIQQVVRMRGKFDNPGFFKGSGDQRFLGVVNGDPVDCSGSFGIDSGIRK